MKMGGCKEEEVKLLMELNRKMESVYALKIVRTKRLNNVSRRGIMISGLGNDLSVTIGVDDILRGMEKGVLTVEDAARRIYERYEMEVDNRSFQDLDFGKISKEDFLRNVRGQLVNRELNEELLKEVPSIRFLDLAVVYRLMIDEMNGSFIIRNPHLEYWNCTVEELETAVRKNMEEYEFQGMREMLYELSGGAPLRLEEEEIMYVLTNKRKVYGAYAMTSTELLANLADKVGCSLYILPSSIHEVIAIPCRIVPDPDQLPLLIKNVNETKVSPEEVLAEHVYKYDLDEKKLRIV